MQFPIDQCGWEQHLPRVKTLARDDPSALWTRPVTSQAAKWSGLLRKEQPGTRTGCLRPSPGPSAWPLSVSAPRVPSFANEGASAFPWGNHRRARPHDPGPGRGAGPDPELGVRRCRCRSARRSRRDRTETKSEKRRRPQPALRVMQKGFQMTC